MTPAQSPATPAEYDDALHMMEAQGGNFVRSLAACYYCADAPNRQRLRGAFEDYFDQYERRFKEHRAAIARAQGAKHG